MSSKEFYVVRITHKYNMVESIESQEVLYGPYKYYATAEDRLLLEEPFINNWFRKLFSDVDLRISTNKYHYEEPTEKDKQRNMTVA